MQCEGLSDVLAGLGARLGSLRRADGDFAKIGISEVNSDVATFVLFLGEQLSTVHWIAVAMVGGGALLLALPI